MTALIMTQDAQFAEKIRGIIEQKHRDFDEVCIFPEIPDVPSLKINPKGCLLLWDCTLPETPIALVNQLIKYKIIYSVILFVQKETCDWLRKGMEIQASDVLNREILEAPLDAAIRKAEGELHEKWIVAMKLKTFRQVRFAVVGGVMRGMLMHSPNLVDLEMLQELGQVPWVNRPGWLIMIHLTNRAEHPEMERTMISSAIGNITEEIFLPLNEMRAMAWMGDDLFALFLQNRGGIEPERIKIVDNLQLIRKYLGQYLNWHVNMYVATFRRVLDTPSIWEDLDKYRKENISLFPGIFLLDDWHAEARGEEASGVQYLRKFLIDGYADIIEKESNNYLTVLINSGKASRSTLRNFYQEYLKMVYSVMWEKGWNAAELFRTEEELELMNNAPNNIAKMKQFLHHVSEYFLARQTERNPKTTVQLVCQYIADHYAEPLTREVLAEYVHLNPDYLTRIFRKETGVALKDFIIHKRLEAAQMLLRGTTLQISEIAEMVGYGNYSYFTQNYRREFGITPKQERDQNSSNVLIWD